MLHQTQQHTLTSPSSSTPPNPIHFSHFHHSKMEHVQNPIKGCFMKETSLKLNQELVQDDLPNAAGFNAITPGEFSVDDLFDFSKMSGCDDEETTLHDVVLAEQTQIPTKTTEMVTDLNGVVVKKETSEICVAADDVADLEWLSHFVEDSFTEYSLTCALPVKNTIAEETLPVEASGKPTRATRSKRVRSGGVSGWSLSGSETTSSSSSSSSTTSLSSASTWLIYTNSVNHNDAVLDSLSNSPPDTASTMKKRKVCKPSSGSKLAQPRRCSHCGVQKTPQWRAGPLGAKTLCNACGVRFKSGRLLPEYRPACSPTFSSELHSNSHRKVLEMRNKKGAELPDSGRVPAVSSF